MADQKIELPVIGMTCSNCAATVERTLKRKVPGVTDAVVNFGTETATVDFDQSITNLAAMAAGEMALSSVTVVLNSLRLSRRKL